MSWPNTSGWEREKEAIDIPGRRKNRTRSRLYNTLLNLQVIGEKDFEKQVSGAIWLNEEGRKKVLSRWQEKKRTDIMHPYLKQKIPLGLLPYVQSNLLAKFVRGELESYPPYLLK